MARRLRIGDHVIWDSEEGRVSGTIIATHASGFGYKGRAHHATEEGPQYEIESEAADHIAAHKDRTLDYA